VVNIAACLSAHYSDRRRKQILEIACLCLISLCAVMIRFYRLGEWSFWGDELFTLSLREDGFNFTVWRQSLASWLIQTTVAIYGSNEWNARLAPAAIGALSIPVLYFPTRRIFGQWTASIAAALLAVSTWHLYWSQNARFYTLLLLFYSLALLAFLIGFEEDRPGWVLLSLLFFGLAAKERLLALFFLPVAGLYLLVLAILPLAKPRGLHWKNLALFFAPLLVGALLFSGPYLRDFAGWMRGFGTPNNGPFWLFTGTIFYVGVPLACLAACGALFLFFFQQEAVLKRAVLLLGLSAGIPLLILMAISPFHYTANRYAFVSLTGWILLAALSLKALLDHLPRNARTLGVGVLLTVLAVPLVEDAMYFLDQNGNREDMKRAAAYIAQHRQPGEQVVANDPPLANYYLSGKIMATRNLRLEEIEKRQNRVWFIEDTNSVDLYPEVHEWLTRRARLSAIFDIEVYAKTYWMRVYLYDPKESE
jgi:4-amino-4-deoxy-L-arabinose transferase-like glycosyltransferase